MRTRRLHWTEHDKIELAGEAKRLAGDLHHYSHPNLNSYTAKIGVFSDYFLERQLAAGKHWSWTDCLLRPWWRFFRAYFLRRGFLDGFPGYYIAKATAFSTLVRYSRLYEHERGTKTVR